MHVDTRLTRGDRVRCLPDPAWPDAPQPIWELLCDPTLEPPNARLEPGHWNLHIRYVTPGTSDNSAVGDTSYMLVRMDEIEFVARAAEPDVTCEGCR
jgi:hypothetical protein